MYSYIVGGLLISFSLYQLYSGEPWEFAMYAVTGCAFITMGFLRQNKFPQYRKILSVVSWILIVLAGILFLFVLRTDYPV